MLADLSRRLGRRSLGQLVRDAHQPRATASRRTAAGAASTPTSCLPDRPLAGDASTDHRGERGADEPRPLRRPGVVEPPPRPRLRRAASSCSRRRTTEASARRGMRVRAAAAFANRIIEDPDARQWRARLPAPTPSSALNRFVRRAPDLFEPRKRASAEGDVPHSPTERRRCGAPVGRGSRHDPERAPASMRWPSTVGLRPSGGSVSVAAGRRTPARRRRCGCGGGAAALATPTPSGSVLRVRRTPARGPVRARRSSLDGCLAAIFAFADARRPGIADEAASSFGGARRSGATGGGVGAAGRAAGLPLDASGETMAGAAGGRGGRARVRRQGAARGRQPFLRRHMRDGVVGLAVPQAGRRRAARRGERRRRRGGRDAFVSRRWSGVRAAPAASRSASRRSSRPRAIGSCRGASIAARGASRRPSARSPGGGAACPPGAIRPSSSAAAAAARASAAAHLRRATCGWLGEGPA